MTREDALYIGGEWVPPSGDQVIEVVSPATEQVVGACRAAAPADVDRAVVAARAAFDEGPWPRLDPAERVATVRRLAEAYGRRVSELAQLITAEMGSPISFSTSAQAAFPGAMLGAHAEVALLATWEERRAGHFGREVLVRREPVGVVAAVIPWNMPMFLLVQKLAPALLAGCSLVLKPAPETPLDALVMAELLDEVGLPPGLVSILPGGRELGAYLVAHPEIDKVSFTGSTAAGRLVAAACAPGLKRVSLELGGKSAAIVLDDADPATVAAGIRHAGLTNAGQVCTAQTRVLLPRSRYAEHVDALAEMVGGLRVGDPEDAQTEIGPLAAQRQQQRVRGYIDSGVSEGARVVVGGAEQPDGLESGWYVRPTLFADVDNRMTIAQEEIFGPVLSAIPYDDEADALRLANDSEYGLSGSVWTQDVDRGLAMARRVRTGTLGVNQPYSMDPAAPFGGMKASGLGRELGLEGLDSYLELKAISVAGSRRER